MIGYNLTIYYMEIVKNVNQSLYKIELNGYEGLTSVWRLRSIKLRKQLLRTQLVRSPVA